MTDYPPRRKVAYSQLSGTSEEARRMLESQRRSCLPTLSVRDEGPAICESTSAQWHQRLQGKARTYERLLKDYDRQIPTLIRGEAEELQDDGLYGIATSLRGELELLRTAGEFAEQIVVERDSGLLQLTTPEPGALMDAAAAMLQDEKTLESTRYAAKCLLQCLVLLFSAKTPLTGDLRDRTFLLCGMLWEQLKQSKNQKVASEAKRISSGRDKGRQARSKSELRKEQFLRERSASLQLSEKFVITHACRTIADREIEAEASEGKLVPENRPKRAKNRAKEIEKQLRKYHPELFR